MHTTLGNSKICNFIGWYVMVSQRYVSQKYVFVKLKDITDIYFIMPMVLKYLRFCRDILNILFLMR